MARLPGVLLRRMGKNVTITPATGWGAFGADSTVRVLVDEQLNTATGQPGAVQTTQIRLLAPLGTACPPGSKVTLWDGRVGYCNGMLSNDYGGLPIPDHVQIAVTVASWYPPPFGEVVFLLRRGAASRDDAGSVRHAATETPALAAVRLLGSAENVDQAQHDVLTDTVELILPPGTPLSEVDRVRVRGAVFDVDGVPEPIGDAMSTAAPGVRVVGRRTYHTA